MTNKSFRRFYNMNNPVENGYNCRKVRARILVQVTINRRLWIGRDGDLDQSKAYDLS